MHDPNPQMITVEIIGQNEGACKTGIPFPQGRVLSLGQLTLTHNNTHVECFALPLSFWSDGSIKWLSISFFHAERNSSPYQLILNNYTEVAHSPYNGSQLKEQSRKLAITTATYQAMIDLERLTLDYQTTCEPASSLCSVSLAGTLTTLQKQPAIAKLTQWHTRCFQGIGEQTNHYFELTLDGQFDYQSEQQPLRFSTVIDFHHTISAIKLTTTLHNPNRARHPSGLWDLGDQGSELFNSFTLNVDFPQQTMFSYKTAVDANWLPCEENCLIRQLSSGGENWQSPVHVDENNQVTLSNNGYEIYHQQKKGAHGDRATPLLHGTTGLGVTVERFWQNFPTSLETTPQQVLLGLFPKIDNHRYELQGGEKKSHTVWLNLSERPDALDWVHTPPLAKADNNWLAACNALPMYRASNDNGAIEQLIKLGLEHPQNFFAKREAIDEYGWRHFGDLYADHETLGYQGEGDFVSHYNNQYDPIYGFIRQFLLSGDARWFELADDLARHVIDIDIYHTEEDKAEYNGGLFWHTDHYLKAYTSSHRSYSKSQAANAYQGRAGGGGPGGQHCYTTGLAYHHLLTGNDSSKQAVITLANWISHVYEGTGTCLELLLAVKNRHVPGLKNPINGQYPFDRGTANYMIALLDCFLLTQQAHYLKRVEHIIRNTIHPADDITSRDLTDIDKNWFYTILLQAICRYLQIKESCDALDDEFYYARDALLHYAEWMLQHEQPYLEKPEILEFPNDTWTAQDLRKAHVLAAASYYSPTAKPEYVNRARFFYNDVSERLTTSPERHYTRILALLMQNHGLMNYYLAQDKPAHYDVIRADWAAANYHNEKGFFSALNKRLFKLSPVKEIRWLKMRLGK